MVSALCCNCCTCYKDLSFSLSFQQVTDTFTSGGINYVRLGYACYLGSNDGMPTSLLFHTTIPNSQYYLLYSIFESHINDFIFWASDIFRNIYFSSAFLDDEKKVNLFDLRPIVSKYSSVGDYKFVFLTLNIRS